MTSHLLKKDERTSLWVPEGRRASEVHKIVGCEQTIHDNYTLHLGRALPPTPQTALAHIDSPEGWFYASDDVILLNESKYVFLDLP